LGSFGDLMEEWIELPRTKEEWDSFVLKLAVSEFPIDLRKKILEDAAKGLGITPTDVDYATIGVPPASPEET